MKKIWKGYQRGVNLGGWLSQCPHTREHYDSFIQKKDMEELAGWGLDHVRVPVDYDLFEHENGFDYVQQVIDWCGEYHLNMVLDLHKTAGYSFDNGEKEDGFFESEEYQERFYQLWEELTKRFAGYQDRLAFELLNEVTEKELCEKWNQIADVCIRRIRRLAPDISILVGGYWNNSVDAVKDLALPQDENIIYNFHCYDPLLFTHQGAHWVDGMPSDFRLRFGCTVREMKEEAGRIAPQWTTILELCSDPDMPVSEQFFRDIFAEAVQTAEERGVCLYCGEYGVIELAEDEDVLKWYQAIHNVFEEYGIGRAAWCYKEKNFGLTDPCRAAIKKELITYL